MIRIALVDDEPKYLQVIEGYINDYAKESGESFEITKILDGEELVNDYRPIYDIIFMDIQMKIMDGMTAAQWVRKFDKNVVLIFITNMIQYAIKGYEVNALNFLLKPVSYFAFSEQLKRSIEQVRANKAHYLLINTDAGIVKLDTAQITHVESFGHKMAIYTQTAEYSVSKTLNELQELLPENFFRCSKSYIINLSYVTSIKGFVVHVADKALSVSRDKKKKLMDELTTYIGRNYPR